MKKLFISLLFGSSLYAGCSSYIGSVTINEVYKPGIISGGDPFIEFASVDGTNIDANWTINVYSNDTQKTYDMVADSCDGDDDYKQLKLDDKDEIDLEDGMSISLVDADGNYVDYLVMSGNDVEGHHGDCSWDDDSDVDTSDLDFLDDSDTYRDPDSTGDWISENQMAILASNNSDCESNDGSSTIYINDDGDTDGDDDSCDEPKYNSINDALTSIRNGDEGDAPFKLKVCGGTYEESLNFDDADFDGLTLKGTKGDVLIKDDSDNLITVDNASIEKISFYNISLEHTKATSCSNDDFLFNFKTNADSSEAKVSMGNFASMKGDSSRLFNFGSSDFGGAFKMNGLLEMQSPCSAVEVNECNNDVDSFEFKVMKFKLTSDKDDQFAFHFGDNVDKDCNISMENISLDMNQSAGIYFNELDNFELNYFNFSNDSDDDTKDAFYVERATGDSYTFDYFNINASGKSFNFANLDKEIDLTMGNSDVNSTMISRNSSGLILPKIQKALLHNIDITSYGKGLELDVDGDLNITGVRLNSQGCGFEFKDGNPLFDDFHINSGECDYSFKKSSCDKLDTSTAFIKNSSFGLKKAGSSTYPLDWSCEAIDLSNSCFCPKQEDDSAAISRNNDFTADGNFWKFLPAGRDYDKDGFQDSEPLESCPFEEFADVCIEEAVEVSRFVAYVQRDDDNVSNSHFTTLKTGSDFNFTISAVNEDNSSDVLDFNGTVCFQIYDLSSDEGYTDWTSLDDFKEEANTTTSENITLTQSTRVANVRFKWQENEDKDCADDDFNENNVSLDHFALIPTKFIIDINSSLMKASELYTLEINATDDDGNLAQDYNQTFSAEDKNVTLWFVSKQTGAEYNTTYSFDISQGEGSLDDFNISDVGEYIIEVVDKEYAIVDAEDTNLSERSIEGNFTIEVTPFFFDLNITKHEASTNQEWAYVSQESNESDWKNNMFYKLEGTLKAKNKNGDVVQRFDKDEYAWDVNTTVNFDLNLSDEDRARYYKQFSNGFDVTTGEFNTSKESFEDGVSSIELLYRVDKNSSNPMEPIRTHLKDFNLTQIGEAEKIITPIDDNITWYYAKIKTFSIETREETTTNKFFITLYKEDTKNLKEVSLNWYKNDFDDGTTTSFEFNASKDTNIDHTADQTIDNITYQQGQVSFDITKNNDKKAIIHIGVPPYLWYSYGVDVDYDYTTSSDCSQHPCSTYIYRDRDNEDGYKIGSGQNSGASISVENRGDVTKKGIKVFR